jgi:penicillin G amidase
MFAHAFVFVAVLSFFFTGCSSSESGTAQVVVQRGEFNQPSIEVRSAPEGQADALLVEAQGYEQARDRLLQMDVLRRLGRGQLAELLGAQSETAEARDRFFYGLGLPQAVQKRVQFYTQTHPEEYALLEAFSRGVNRRIAELEQVDPDTLKLYRQLTRDLSYSPRLWEPADTLAVAQNIAFYLSSRIQSKLSLGVISMTSDDKERPWTIPRPERLSKNLDTRSIIPAFILDADRSQNPWLKKLEILDRSGGPKRKQDGGLFSLPLFSCIGHGFPIPECGQEVTVGSNSFVAGKSYTQNRDVIIGNDPHLMLALPMTFYEGAYDSTPAGGTFRVRGFNLPGIPLVLIGHNAHLGWALTNLAADVDDVYLEFLQGDSGDEVRRTVGGEIRSLKLDIQTFPIKVRNRFGRVETREVVVRSVPGHGPIFTDHDETLQQTLTAAEKMFSFKLAASYKWVGQEPSGEFAAIAGISRATTYRESIEALKHFSAGAQNVVIGTKSGDIGYFAHGKFPIRNYLSDTQPPFVPVVALDGQEKEWAPQWREEVPQLFNPASDSIVTANNDPFGHSARPRLSEWEDYFSVWFSPGVRAARIRSLMESMKGSITLENAAALQYDHKDLLVDAYLDLLRPLLADEKLQLSAGASEFARRLAGWDARMVSHLEEPVMAEGWVHEVMDAFMHKFVSPTHTDFALHAQKQTTLLVRSTYHRLSDFLKGSKADQKIGHELLKISLEKASQDFAAKPAEARLWGQQHRLQFANVLEGILPSFASLPFPRQGSPFTVDLSHGPMGPGFRMLLRIPESGAIEATAAVPGGNYASSDAANVYRELVPWLKGQYRPLVQFVTP